MGAALGDATLVEDENQARLANGAETVGDDERGAATQQDFEGALEAGFGDGVDGAGGFVQHKDARVGEERAGETDELTLAEGEGGALFADLSFESLRQRFEKVEAIEVAQDGADIGFGGGGSGEADVFEHRAGEEEVVLLDAAHLGVEGVAGDPEQVAVIDEDAAGGREIELLKQPDDGGFAAASVSDQRDGFAGFRDE